MTENGGTPMYMPVAPAYGNGGGMGGFGFDNGWWVIFFLIIMMGGWGNGFGFGGGGNGMFPWLMAGQTNGNNDVTRGFDQAALVNGITGVHNAVTAGFGDMQTALCSGFGNVQNALCSGFGTINSNIANGFAQSEIAANARQIAGLQQDFALQTGIAGVGTTTAAGLADLKYALATEGCNTRATSTANTQAILDKLCDLELQGVKNQLDDARRDNLALQNQLNMANMKASEVETRAYIAQGLNNEVDALYNRLNSCPVPTTPVYGRTPIFTCGGNCGCGCGMAA